MTPDVRKNIDVIAGERAKSAILRIIRLRTLALFCDSTYPDQVARVSKGKRFARDLGNLIRDIRGDRTVMSLIRKMEDKPPHQRISHSRWRQIESGDVPPAETLWEIAVALDATASQIEQMFMLADLGTMIDGLLRIGATRIPDAPGSAEIGIRIDPTLSGTAKAKALDYLDMLRRSGEGS